MQLDERCIDVSESLAEDPQDEEDAQRQITPADAAARQKNAGQPSRQRFVCDIDAFVATRSAGKADHIFPLIVSQVIMVLLFFQGI